MKGILLSLAIGISLGILFARVTPGREKNSATDTQVPKKSESKNQQSPRALANTIGAAEVLAGLRGISDSDTSSNITRGKVRGLIARADISDLAEIYQESLESSRGDLKAFWNLATTTAVELWSQIAPAEAWDKVLSEEGSESPRNLLIAAKARLFATPNEYLDELTSQEESSIRSVMIRGILELVREIGFKSPVELIQDYLAEHSESDLDVLRDQLPKILALSAAQLPYKDALAWLNERQEEGKGDLAALLFRELLSAHPSRIGDLVENVFPNLDPRERKTCALMAGVKWVHQDQQAAMEWIRSLPNEIRGAVTKNALYVLGDSSVKDAKAAISLLDSGSVPKGMPAKVAWGLALESGNQEALAWLDSLPKELRDAGKERFLARLASVDPLAASQMVPDGKSANPEVLGTIAGTLANSDGAAALEWISNLGDIEIRGELEQRVFRRWASTAPLDAAAAAMGIQDEEARGQSLAAVGQIWALNDWDGAFEWASGLAGPAREDAMRVVLSYPTEVASASQQLIQFLDEDPAFRNSIALKKGSATLATQLVWQDPDQATEWIGRLPAGDVRDSAILASASEWSRHDPVGTSEWLAGLEASTGRDAAVVELVANIKDDPESAFTWAAFIGDEERRLATLEAVARDWHTVDPSYAIDRISEFDISEEDRASLLEMLNNPPTE